ncbi:hypothetical protein [Corynebacterium pilosum]|uniref:Or membrane protein n=1 Tax=Corynebacterium pilosum TaxID=35756 RepID=A0A376CII7_9CORY|nr:hypothetical protein [Corynebacterium pilosum]STC68113.1 or membrane protein [Corynebacterium pilosum]
MRKFRNAALAAATAVTVTFAGVSVADAQTNGTDVTWKNPGLSSARDADADTVDRLSSTWVDGGSSAVGEATDAGKPVNAINLLGSSVDDSQNPLWSLLWRDGAGIAAIAAAVGGVIAAYNYAVYQGIIPHAIQF